MLFFIISFLSYSFSQRYKEDTYIVFSYVIILRISNKVGKNDNCRVIKHDVYSEKIKLLSKNNSGISFYAKNIREKKNLVEVIPCLFDWVKDQKHLFISMGESNTVVNAYTLYRHLQQYCSHSSIYTEPQKKRGNFNYSIRYG